MNDLNDYADLEEESHEVISIGGTIIHLETSPDGDHAWLENDQDNVDG